MLLLPTSPREDHYLRVSRLFKNVRFGPQHPDPNAWASKAGMEQNHQNEAQRKYFLSVSYNLLSWCGGAAQVHIMRWD